MSTSIKPSPFSCTFNVAYSDIKRNVIVFAENQYVLVQISLSSSNNNFCRFISGESKATLFKI